MGLECLDRQLGQAGAFTTHVGTPYIALDACAREILASPEFRHSAVGGGPVHRSRSCKTMTRCVHTFAPIARLLPVVVALVAPSVALAQNGTIPIRSMTTPVLSKESFAFQPTVRGLPGERLLVNDQRGKRLLVFDSTLASFTIIADSVSSTGVSYSYSGAMNPLMRYIGDSTLLVDFDARVYTVIDPNGKIVRAMAPVKSFDLSAGSRLWAGTPASDTLGRLIFRGTETRPRSKEGDPPITDTRDTITIVRADFNARTTDTIAAFSVPRVPSTVFTKLPNGKTAGSLVINAGLSGPDHYAVLSDGTLAIVREHDYVVDWVNPDGTKSSTAKLPFEWVRQTNAMKQARIDSMKRVIDSVSAAGRPYGMTIRYFASVESAPSRQDTIIPTIQFAPLADMADYVAPVRRGQVKADEDGNLWVLPSATSLAKGGLLYDVINKKDGLHERVQIPPDYLVVGFGRRGVVYLAKNDTVAKTWTLAKVRVVRGKS